MSYIGNEPIVSATRTVTEISATAGQTVFTANGGYTVGFIDVFVNGSKLTNSDFTATNGTTITLNEAAQASDIVRLEALGTFLTSSGLTANNPNYTGTLTGGTGVVNIGSGQLYKDGSGNVGIGTSSPTAGFRLDVVGGDFRVSDVASDDGVEIGWSAGGDRGFVQAYDRNASAFRNLTLNNAATVTSDGLLQFNSGYGSVATAYGCRAWVNFNGTGTVAIRASGNVSSITDNSAGDYTVNFTTALPDANYSACISSNDISWGNKVSFVDTGNYLTTALRIKSFSGSLDTSSQADTSIFCVAVFR